LRFACSALGHERVAQIVGVRLQGDHLAFTPVLNARDVNHLDLDPPDVDHDLRIGREHHKVA
jgi:hypothetical protein